MSSEDARLSRLQAIMTALLKHRLSESLERVHGALERFKAGDLGPFEAHGAVLEHAARSERLASRVSQLGPSGARTALRDAYDAGVIERSEFVELAECEPDEVEPSPSLDEPVPSAPDKREFVEELLVQGPTLIHIDARRDDVDVPDRFRGDPKLVLRFGHGLTPAIADLSVDDDGVAGTLTFGGVPHHCVLPWPAIYAAVCESDQRGMVWPDEVPEEVLDQMAREESKSSAEAAPPGAERKDAGEDGDRDGDEKKPIQRGHLKLVD